MLGSVNKSLWHRITGRGMRKTAQVSLLGVFCHAHLVMYWTLSSSLLDGTAVFSVRWRFRAERFSHVARHRASGVSFIHLFRRNLGICSCAPCCGSVSE